jgi:putative ABC transport system permease protein
MARKHAPGVRLSWKFESLWQDTSFAIRLLRRSPAFAGAMILVTSLGIGATTAVFGLIDELILSSLPVREPERLVWFRNPAFSDAIFDGVQARGSQVFAGLFAWSTERLNVEWAGELEPAEVLLASGAFYSTLGVGAHAGRTFTPDDDRIGGGPGGMVAVISYPCWRRRFGGDAAVIGRTLRIERRPFTIVGVTPPGFFGVAPGLAPEITIPLKTLQNVDTLRGPTSAWLHIMGRLRAGLTIERANAALQVFWPAVLEVTTGPGEPADRRAKYLARKTALEPARTGYSRIRNRFGDPLWMLLALVGLLLAIATASAANLLFARGIARRREMAVRLALGANRARIVRQMLTEALVLTALGGAFGVPLASAASRALIAIMRTRNEPIALDLGPNWHVVAFIVTLTLTTAAVCAILPALRATRLDQGSTLKGSRQVGSGLLRRWTLGRSLVALQVALTVLLLVGAALFVRSLQRVLSQNAGFERDSVIVLWSDPMAVGYTGPRLTAFYDTLLQKLGTTPGVESASLSWYPPISEDDGHWTQSVAVDGAAFGPENGRYVYFNAISPGYFRTVGTGFVDGRDFTDSDIEGSRRVVIVNESLARRYFPGQNPLGRRITVGRHQSRRNLEIVGIARDAKYQRLQEPSRSIAYLPYQQLAEYIAGTNLVAEVRAAGPIASLSASVRLAARALDSQMPIRIETVGDRIGASLVTERVVALLASATALAALVLASAALYGLLAYTVSRETSAIGLRLALGASRAAVLTNVLRECLTLAVIGLAIGLGAALALGRFASRFLFQVSALDPPSLIAASVLMIAVASCAGFLPARRAANIDPAIALKAE